MSATDFSFQNQLLTEVAKWAVPLIGGIVAVFFTPLIESLKLRLGRADLRVRQYEEFAKDLSTFIFEAEVQHEFLSSTWATVDDMNDITKSYNQAITTLRSKELVYLAWASKYWNKHEFPQFENVLAQVKAVDMAVHCFNDGKRTPEKLSALSEGVVLLQRKGFELLAPK